MFRELIRAWAFWLMVMTILALCCALNVVIANARDAGQWADQDPLIGAWFATLKQPDNPVASCCGEADAYWADQVETDADGRTVAVITDDRPDEPLKRPHVPIGTRIVVPPNKIKWDQGNPTGHIVIFLGYELRVYCYVQNGGV
jgi:hypothetical protein